MFWGKRVKNIEDSEPTDTVISRICCALNFYLKIIIYYSTFCMEMKLSARK
jgi:hypothetical protein